MTEVWATSPAKGSKLLLLLAIADFSNDTGESYPGMKTLADKIRMNRRTVLRLVDELTKEGLLEVEKRASQYGTNRYRIISKQPELPLGNTSNDTSDKLSRGDTHVTSLATPMSPKPLVNRQTPTSPDSKVSEEVVGGDNIRSFPVPVKDLSEAIFKNEPGTCLFYMIARGYSDRQSRGLLGKWRKQIGDAALVEIMGAASRKQVENVVEYMSGAVRARKARTVKAERDHVSVL